MNKRKRDILRRAATFFAVHKTLFTRAIALILIVGGIASLILTGFLSATIKDTQADGGPGGDVIFK